eukprot:6098552-Pyramimonas_sp.AAC.1
MLWYVEGVDHDLENENVFDHKNKFQDIPREPILSRLLPQSQPDAEGVDQAQHEPAQQAQAVAAPGREA